MVHKSKSESPTQSGSFNILVDMVLVNGVFDYLLDTEGHISAGVEIGGSLSEGTFSGSPCFNFTGLKSMQKYCHHFLLLRHLHDPSE